MCLYENLMSVSRVNNGMTALSWLNFRVTIYNDSLLLPFQFALGNNIDLIFTPEHK